MRRSYKGNFNPAYKDGRCSVSFSCMDCGGKISKSTALNGYGRCNKCRAIYTSTLTKVYCCSDCGGYIHRSVALRGNSRCEKCWFKYKSDNKQPSRNYCCRDCGDLISLSSVYGNGRCLSCNQQRYKGKNNPNYGNGAKTSGKLNYGYKTGKYTYQHHCLICGTPIGPKATWCQNHCHIEYSKKKVPHVHIVGKYNGVWMRSSWELNFAKWLDCSGYKWEYESKIFDLVNTSYTPDFYLPEFNCYIEIKGFWWKDAKLKFKKFKHKYPKINILIYQRKNLECLGVI